MGRTCFNEHQYAKKLFIFMPMFACIFLHLIVIGRSVYWKLVATSVVVASLFVIENIVFNLLNRWNNIVFNFYRQRD